MCTNGLRSRGNYWGVVTNRSRIVEFFQCPPSYCCPSQRDRVSYNTCTNNRRGRLCGDCKADHSIALFGPNRCVPNDNCKHDLLWIPYVFAVLFVLITILYLKDIFSFIGKLLARMRNTNGEHQTSMYREIPYLEPLIESNTMANENMEFFQQKNNQYEWANIWTHQTCFLLLPSSKYHTNRFFSQSQLPYTAIYRADHFNLQHQAWKFDSFNK